MKTSLQQGAAMTAAAGSLPATRRDTWIALLRQRQIVRQFTPNWFALTMGTGIVFLTMTALPLASPDLHRIARALWIGDSGLFILLTVLFGARLLFYRDTVRPMLDHPVQSMFLGTIPMGLIPIVNGLVIFGMPAFGVEALPLAETLWWVDVVLALGIAVLVPYRMFTRQTHAMEQMTAVWLLPIVAPEVAASSAGVLAPHLAVDHAQQLIGVGYLLWAVSVPLAFSILTIVFMRLALHKLPHRDMAASSWLTLGPIGTGSLGLLLLGQDAVKAFAGTPLESVAVIARDGGLLGAGLLWGAGLWWLAIAALSTLHYWRRQMSFNLGWWGFTFPLGVYTVATLSLYRTTGWSVFAAIGTVLSGMLLAFWLIVASKTLVGIWHGTLFHAPCLASIRDE